MLESLPSLRVCRRVEHVALLKQERVKRYGRKLLIDGEPRWTDIEEFDSSEPIVDRMPGDHLSQIAVAARDVGGGCSRRVGAADSYP